MTSPTPKLALRLTTSRAEARLTSATDDAELVAACLRGEAPAPALLYHRYKRRVFGVVQRIVGPGDAEEVAQEAFVRVFRGLARFRGDAQLSTWIYRLAVNAALSHVERRPPPAQGEEALARLPAHEPTRGDPVLAARLERALGRLPAGYRAVLVLHDVEGLQHDEIAEVLGCRVGTSKSQLHKARQRMRELLAADGLGPITAEELR